MNDELKDKTSTSSVQRSAFIVHRFLLASAANSETGN
jgi:hypothetical protein